MNEMKPDMLSLSYRNSAPTVLHDYHGVHTKCHIQSYRSDFKNTGTTIKHLVKIKGAANSKYNTVM